MQLRGIARLVGGVLALAASAVVPLATAAPASATLAQPTTGAYLWFSSAGGEETTTNVTVVDGSPSLVHFQLASALTGWATDAYFAPAPGQELVAGTYEQATAWSAPIAGRPGIGILKGPYGGCFGGRFIVDQVAFDGSQQLTAFSVRFQADCSSGNWFGAISYQATADFRSISESHDLSLPDTATGSTSAPTSFTITNNGPSALHVASATIAGVNATEFGIPANGCSTTLAAGQSCAIQVAFSPTGAAGFRSAQLALVDELSPAGGPPRTYPLQAYAFVPPPPPVPTGEYTALTPARILDTRGSTGVACNKSLTKLGPVSSFDVQVTGCGQVPTTGASAIVMNVTVTEATAASYQTVWPKATSRPIISNLNYVKGQTVPNLVTVKLGAGGMVSVYNNAGSAHVVIDVVGFYAAPDGPLGLRFHPSNPTRLVDTRLVNYPIKAGVPFNRRIEVYRPEDGSGVNDVKAVVLNVTVTEPTAAGHLTIYPDDVPKPLASSLNFTPGLTVPNLVVVRVPADRGVIFENSAGQLHLVIDVMGWYDLDKTTDGGRFVPLDPFRRFDTRTFVPPTPLGPQTILSATMVPSPGLPAPIQALMLNVTVTQPTNPGFLTVYADNPLGPGFPPVGPPPGTSNLNFVPGEDVPNAVVVSTAKTGRVGFYNPYGFTHVVVDVFGYFTSSLVAPFDAGGASAPDIEYGPAPAA